MIATAAPTRTTFSDLFTALAAHVAVTHYRYQEQVWITGLRAELDALIDANIVKAHDKLIAWDMPPGTGLPARAPSYPIYRRRLVLVNPPAREPEPEKPVMTTPASDARVLPTSLLKLLQAADKQLPTKTALNGSIWLKSVRNRATWKWEKEVDPLFNAITLEAHAAGFITATVHIYTDKWIAYASIPMTVKAQVDRTWRATVYADAILPLVKLLKKNEPLDLSYVDDRLVIRQGRSTTRLVVLQNDVFYDHALPREPEPTPEPAPALAVVLALPAPACSICAEPAPRHSYADKPVCDNCNGAILSYSIKVKGRAERLYNRAENARSEAKASYDRAHEMAQVIPFGQPILVGHHSEKRDRAFRDRIWRGFERSYHRGQEAEELERRARASEKNRAISSDDPAAVLKLQEKLGKLTAEQERMKAINKHIYRLIGRVERMQTIGHHGTVDEINARFRAERARVAAIWQTYPQKALELAQAAGISEQAAIALLTPDMLGRIGFADYQLKNNNAEIRRVLKRIDELQAKRTTVAENARESQYGDIRLERDAEENRLRLHFPGKPARAIIDCLKSNGFRWSPYNKAWQRQLNASAEYAAQRVIEFTQQQ